MNGQAAEALSGAAIIGAMKAAGIRFVAALPDIVTSDGLLWPISRGGDFRLIRLCKEDEGVSICAAMSYSGTRAVLLMQQTGFMDSLNAVRAIAVDYQLPVVMLVGMQGKEENVPVARSAVYGVRIVPPILDVMGIGWSEIETDGDCRKIGGAINMAYSESRPHVFLIGRSPSPP